MRAPIVLKVTVISAGTFPGCRDAGDTNVFEPGLDSPLAWWFLDHKVDSIIVNEQFNRVLLYERVMP